MNLDLFPGGLWHWVISLRLAFPCLWLIFANIHARRQNKVSTLRVFAATPDSKMTLRTLQALQEHEMWEWEDTRYTRLLLCRWTPSRLY